MDKQQAIVEAAEAVLEHGGPECRTDPREPLSAMGRAYDAGATDEDIRAEIARQRTT
ncbi:hypothetical protein [Streptomyces niveus]|uniref:hypothetical protein n=1 Tax=Streptomyces niveus TaxID=193462 RepID=UPI00386A2CA3